MLDTLFSDGFTGIMEQYFQYYNHKLAMQETKHKRRNLIQQKEQNTTEEIVFFFYLVFTPLFTVIGCFFLNSLDEGIILKS